MVRSVLALLCTALISAGCGEDTTQPPTEEIFIGRLEVIDQQAIPPDTLTVDSVRFSVRGQEYQLDHLTMTTNLCSSIGEIAGFGTNSFILTPTVIIPSPNCNETRVPKGQFDAEFRADSLILGPKLFRFDVGGGIFESYIYTLLLTQ